VPFFFLLGAYGTNKEIDWVPFFFLLGAYGTNKEIDWVPTAQTTK